VDESPIEPLPYVPPAGSPGPLPRAGSVFGAYSGGAAAAGPGPLPRAGSVFGAYSGGAAAAGPGPLPRAGSGFGAHVGGAAAAPPPPEVIRAAVAPAAAWGEHVRHFMLSQCDNTPTKEVKGLSPSARASELASFVELKRVGLCGLHQSARGEIPCEPGEKMGVRYVRRGKERYLCEISRTIRRNGKNLDSTRVKQIGFTKLKPETKQAIGFSFLGKKKTTGTDLAYKAEWYEHSIIWVCLPDGAGGAAFYSNTGKVRRFHHSSLAEGRDVIGAGEWIVNDGALRKISANSGHYRPTMSMLYQSVLLMTEAFRADTTVFLYDSNAEEYVDYPVLDFKANPSNGGRFWVHADAPLM
jgi:hypothetical protein